MKSLYPRIAELPDKEKRQLKACMNNFMGTMLEKKRALAERKIEAGVEDEDNEQIPFTRSDISGGL